MYPRETHLTTVFRRKNWTDSLAAAVVDMEKSLDVQDLEDLRELSDTMYDGLATTRETHAKLRKTKNTSELPKVVYSICFDSFGFAHCSSRGRGRGGDDV